MLKHADELRRKEMTTVLMEKIESTKSFLSHLWTTDEAHFHLDGQVNSKNNIFWGSSRPDEVNETPLHSQKVTMWCALSMKGIIGPLFFEESGQTVTVTKERKMVLHLIQPISQSVGSRNTSNTVLSASVARLVGFFTPLILVPQIFLWGYLKDRVYKGRPKTFTNLKQKIKDEVKEIKRSVLKWMMENFALRMLKCKNQSGGHLEHLL
ncbi:hypothetical protein LOD99_14614 [Oopsacas minuta]|uniref:Transposase n=1 Tax=Oopsacas minuta TaxID=111878 RepID=A0AAV7KFM8_9METZ|nr:hypothetical protein LOD99_14614 [Oopsacas minuta]